jgi:hypothetical protein
MLGMCYIICTISSSVCYVASGAQGGLRGKHVAFLPRFLCHLNFCVHCWAIFRHMVFFAYGFLFMVKELGLLTNPSHWIRVLDATGSYMYIVL